jgi:Na+/melibiose symporter-like transporter
LKKLPFNSLLIVNAYWIGLSFMWNVIHPLMLPAVLSNMVTEGQQNTVLGILTFIGLFLAMIVQPVSGALSDHWASRWGRRRPLITLGTTFDFVFLAILAWSGRLEWVFIGYIGLQITSNIAHGPAQGLVPDVVPQEQLAQASSIKIFIDMLCMVVGLVVASFLIDPKTTSPVTIMLVVIGLLAVSAATTIIGTREQPSTRTSEGSVWKELMQSLKIRLGDNPPYWWLIALRFIFLMGVYGIQGFAFNYIKDVVKAANPVMETGLIMGSLSVFLLAFIVLAGWLTDRFSAKAILFLSGIVTAAGCLLLMLARTRYTLMAFGSIVGAGMGLFLTSNWTMANRLAPAREAGKYIGLTNIATAGAGALARLEGPVIDKLNALQPGAYYGYMFLFVFAAICALASLILLPGIKEGKISKRSVL